MANNRGAWTPEEDQRLAQVIETQGPKRWKSIATKAGLNRCGKSCRLRWMNYLRPNIKRGNISAQEEDLILRLHKLLGNRWSLIAGRLPGRTDNEIKNYWNSHLSKKAKQISQLNKLSVVTKQGNTIIASSVVKTLEETDKLAENNSMEQSVVIKHEAGNKMVASCSNSKSRREERNSQNGGEEQDGLNMEWGDPLGPLLFAIALQPLVRQVGELCPRLLLNAWYLDDGVLMGRQVDLVASFEVIRRLGPQLGLVVNLSKSVWWWPGGGRVRPQGLPDVVGVSDSSALSVLGNPISVDGRGAEEIVGRRVRGIMDVLAEMSKLDDPQLELLLLRACVGMPKMMYNLRSAPPCWIEGSIRSFDSAVHQSLVHIYNAGFTADQRRLVGLPIKFGGLGVPIGSEVALSAAVASLVQAGGLWELLTKDLFSSSRCGVLLAEWNIRFRPRSPVGMEELRSKAKPQQWLSGLAAEVIRDEIKGRGGARVCTLVNAVSVSGSGIWTTAIPTPFSGLHMNPAAYRMALKYRTGRNVFPVSQACTSCRGLQTSDAAGDHDSHCPGGGRRIRRHNAVRDALFTFFREANLGPRLEVAGLLEGGEKPADILVPAWDDGKDLCVDVSIVSPFVGEGAEMESGEAARRAEERKISIYGAGCSANGLIFEPFIMESLGGFGGRADRLIRTVAARWAEAKGLEPPAALSILRQKLSFVSQKALGDGFLLRNG
ncbi:unnamed protein product [Rhodiola kirilowii]